MKHKILIALALFTLLSCMKIKKKDDDQPQAQTAAEIKAQSQPSDKLTYKYIADKSQSVNKIQFLAPSGWPKTVLLKKSDGSKSSEFEIEFNESYEWSDLLITENKVYYQFYSFFDGQPVLLEEVEVLPPLNTTIEEDLNLAKQFNLNSKTKYIYFENLNIGLQKHLYLENFSGKIQIKNLISKSGFIQSFPISARAENDVDGKDGGVIELEILNGSGDVTVFMKGENGGNGSLAKPPDDFIKGEAGGPGASAKFKPVYIPDSIFPYYACVAAPGNGTNGSKGLNGYNGNSGKSGGHSGRASVFVSSNNLEVFLTSQEGVFGNGSPGGIGGEGGDPGLGSDGENDFKIQTKGNPMIQLIKKCEPSMNGEKGPTGDPGLPGGSGVNGSKQRSCLQVIDKKVKCINESY